MPKIEDNNVYDYKSERTKSVLFTILPYVFSVIFIALGLYLGIARGAVPAAHFSNFVEVTATVDEVLEYKQPNDKPSKFRLKLSYTYGKTKYSNRLGTELHNATNCPVEKSQIKVMINPNNPIDMVEKIKINYAEMIIGFGLTVVGGVIITIQSIKLTKSKKKAAMPKSSK